MTVALITGASRGIGKAVALALAARGLDVALVARSGSGLDAARADERGDPREGGSLRSPRPHSSALEEVAALARAEGVRALALAADVANEAEVTSACARAVAELGEIDVAVASAGIVHRGARVEETSVASWDEVMGVNLRGSFLVARALVPSMRARDRGRLVFVGSISSTIGCPGVASYAASKWGLVGFVKSLAEELRGTSVAALSVLPGSVDTEMLVGSGFEPAMTADDVAGAIVYAALDAPLAMNGSAIEMFG